MKKYISIYVYPIAIYIVITTEKRKKKSKEFFVRNLPGSKKMIGNYYKYLMFHPNDVRSMSIQNVSKNY